MPAELKLWERALLDQSRARQVRRIYEDSFLPLERVPFDQMLASVVSGREFMLILEEGETVLGFALLRWLVELKMLYLEFIAVDRSDRGRGYGGRILRRIIELAQARPGILGVILEVDSPDDEVEEEEKAVRLRRMQFYQRHGAELVEDNGAYFMPDFTGLGSMPMKLMWIPARPAAQGYPARDLRTWLVHFYREAYGRGEDDPFLQQILHRLPEH